MREEKQGDIDGRVAQLLKEKEDEINHKDFLFWQDREKEDFITKVEDLVQMKCARSGIC